MSRRSLLIMQTSEFGPVRSAYPEYRIMQSQLSAHQSSAMMYFVMEISFAVVFHKEFSMLSC